MIIAKSEKDIERIVDHYKKEGFVALIEIIDNERIDLDYWKDFMIVDLQKRGVLIFEPKWEWDSREKIVKRFLIWDSPVTVDEFLEE